MVLSMTGYGRGEAHDKQLAVVLEIKAVNHRYFEAVINMPLRSWELESRLKENLRTALNRGHVDCYLHVLNPVPGTREPIVDVELAARYAQALRRAGVKLGLKGEPDLMLIARLPEVVRVEERPVQSKPLLRLVDAALAQALKRLRAMRLAEGRRLSADIRQRVQSIKRTSLEIRRLVQEKVKRLQSDARLGNGKPKSENGESKRAVQDAALQSMRADVTEEIVRLDSHVTQFGVFMQSGGPVGRRLDFLIQEMNREINTIGSKSADARIAHRVVSMKEELEKIREQVQNLE